MNLKTRRSLLQFWVCSESSGKGALDRGIEGSTEIQSNLTQKNCRSLLFDNAPLQPIGEMIENS
jgi:hypothetical protein